MEAFGAVRAWRDGYPELDGWGRLELCPLSLNSNRLMS
jgi:hypothetical protein